jgi:hypothetical protein
MLRDIPAARGDVQAAAEGGRVVHHEELMMVRVFDRMPVVELKADTLVRLEREP